MISPTSITKDYILQPTLIAKHKKTLEWLSTAVLWKIELGFFQKVLDQHSIHHQSVSDKQKIDHFQNIIIYYKGELIDALMSRLRQHEKKLAEILESKDETRVEYFSEHSGLMQEAEALNEQFIHYKEELFALVEDGMKH